MKHCTVCGGDYPDDAATCPKDGNALRPQPRPNPAPSMAPAYGMPPRFDPPAPAYGMPPRPPEPPKQEEPPKPADPPKPPDPPPVMAPAYGIPPSIPKATVASANVKPLLILIGLAIIAIVVALAVLLR